MNLQEYLKSKGFDPNDMPITIKKEWRNFPICKAMLEYSKQMTKASEKEDEYGIKNRLSKQSDGME